MNSRAFIAELVSVGKPLVLADLSFKAIQFVVFTPLLTLILRGMLAVTGTPVLTDVEIISFILSPTGAVCAFVVATSSLSIGLVEQAALVGVVAEARAGRRMSVLASLQFALSRFGSLLGLAARFVGYTVPWMVPFLLAGFLTWFVLLSGRDINFYLDQRPPVFIVALAIGGALAASMVACLLYLFTGWFFALPLVCVEGTTAARAMRQSRSLVRGRRKRIFGWLLGWGISVVLLSVLITGLTALVCRTVVLVSPHSLHFIALTAGLALLFSSVVGVGVNVLANTTFAGVLLHLFLEARGVTQPADQSPEPQLSVTENDSFRIRFLSVAIATVLLLIVAGIIGELAVSGVESNNDVQIIAHRGASHEAPENTLSAVRLAIEQQADWVEIDVQETADGEVVVFHDSDFMRLSGRPMKIWNATTEDLQQMDVSGRFFEKYANERVPTLHEVLKESRGRVNVLIELKYYGHDERLEQRVAEIVQAERMDAHVMGMSLKPAGVAKLKTLRPEWKTGLLMSVSAGNVSRLQADFLAVNIAFTSKSLIQESHRANKQVFVWTVNDPLAISAAISLGVDGVITDRPALARAVLEERKSLSRAELIMLEMARLFSAKFEI